MSLQRYWTSFKESFLGTITSLKLKKPVVEEEDEIKAIKNGFAEHNEKNGVGKEEEGIVNGQNGHSHEPPLIIDEVDTGAQVNNNSPQEEKEEGTVQSKSDKVEKDEEINSSSDEEEDEKAANRPKGEVGVEQEESSDEEESVAGNFHELERLHVEAKTCQKCKETFETAGEASKCLNTHKRVRCYFCFYTCTNTEKLFDHFAKKHIQAGREKFLLCPYCEMSVPFKSVSCHVISTHLTDKSKGSDGLTRSSAPTPPGAPTTSRRSARGHPSSSEPPPPSKRAKQNDGIYWVD